MPIVVASWIHERDEPAAVNKRAIGRDRRQPSQVLIFSREILNASNARREILCWNQIYREFLSFFRNNNQPIKKNLRKSQCEFRISILAGSDRLSRDITYKIILKIQCRLVKSIFRYFHSDNDFEICSFSVLNIHARQKIFSEYQFRVSSSKFRADIDWQD